MREHLMYVITAQVFTTDGNSTGSRQIPTFYLDSAVQGITSPAHAVRIAKEIIDPLGGFVDVSIHAEPRIVAVSA